MMKEGESPSAYVTGSAEAEEAPPPAAPVCTLTAEQLDAYAARIGITLPLDATLDNLRMLIAAHHRSVPFENTALHMREKLPPDDMQHAYARIVEGRRGGICTDLNGMFAQLLSSLGFGVRFFATRVWLPTQVFTPIFMHMGLAVTIPGDNGRLWLADVGFPSMTYGPLDLSCNNTAHDEDKGDTFEVKLLNDGDVQVAMNGKLLFHAELRPRAASDFGLMVWFYCSSPEASLMMNYLCTRATDEGRVTIAGNRLIETIRGGDRIETQLNDEETLQAYDSHFGIKLKELPPITKPEANVFDFWFRYHGVELSSKKVASTA